MDVEDFLKKYNTLDMTFEWVKFRPGGSMFPIGSNHYKVTIHGIDDTYTFYYSMGPALKDGPTIHEILECIASDCALVEECRDLAEFLIEFGYVGTARDIRYGYQQWIDCFNEREYMKNLIGEKGFEEFMNIEWEYEYKIGEK